MLMSIGTSRKLSNTRARRPPAVAVTEVGTRSDLLLFSRHATGPEPDSTGQRDRSRHRLARQTALTMLIESPPARPGRPCFARPLAYSPARPPGSSSTRWHDSGRTYSGLPGMPNPVRSARRIAAQGKSARHHCRRHGWPARHDSVGRVQRHCGAGRPLHHGRPLPTPGGLASPPHAGKRKARHMAGLQIA